MGAFAPTPPQTEDQTQGSPAGAMGAFAPQQGFEGGEVAGTPPSDPTANVAEQNEGIFETFQEIQMGLQSTSDFLMTLSGQFPGAAEPIRQVLEPIEAAAKGLIGIIQAVTVEASQPTPSAPRSSFG